MATTTRYLLLSDLHLADVEDHADGWKAHKHSRHTFDPVLDAVVDGFLAGARPYDTSTVILNGDIVDFDLVTAIPEHPAWPVSPRERRRGLAATAEKSAWKLQQILAHHAGFVSTLARVLGQGHTVVWVIGNHDLELCFAEAQTVLGKAVAASQEAQGFKVCGAVTFEPWFYFVPGEIYVEHGHQYDRFSSQDVVLQPTDCSDGPERAVLSMGNVSNRTLLGRMGYFNPHASDYILSGLGYITHWLRHYAFTRRSLVFSWLLGSIAVFFELLGIARRRRRNPPNRAAALQAEAVRKGLPLDVIEAIDAGRRQPVDRHPWRMARELWLDRVLLATLMVGGTVALGLSPVPLWVALMVPLCGFPLLYLVYDGLATGDSIYSMEQEAHQHARAIARLLPVRVVSFGHSHVPEVVPLAPGVSYANTGTWAAMPRADLSLEPGLRNALVVTCSAGRAHLSLESHQVSPLMPPLAHLHTLPVQTAVLEAPHGQASELTSSAPATMPRG
ncbi:MAG: UDP-2,3-diacylglucosamine pyrophosphatase LpxH [Myxococcota bacterium]|jgi:UDP-2,3-diacylglucosamine pyrophosphatase LpxH